MVQREDEKTWKKIYQQEIRNCHKDFQKLKNLNPKIFLEFETSFLWGVLYLFSEDSENFEIFLTMDHSISDGQTMNLIMGEILYYYQKLQSDDFDIPKLIPF